MLSRVGKMLPSLSGGGLYGAGYPAGQVLGGETSGFAIDFTSPGANLLMRSGTIPGNYVGYPFVREGGPVAFSRASNATVTDADGKIKWAAHNLLTNSESFDASAWTKTQILSTTANATAAPDGTTTADLIIPNTTSAIHQVLQSASASNGASYTMGIFIKPNGYSKFALIEGENTGYFVSYNATGSGSVLDSSNATGTITPLANGWYYATHRSVSGGTAFRLQLIILPASYTSGSVTGSWSPDGTSGIYLWGAALYRSDLGGMVANTSAYPYYNPTTPKNLLGYTEDFSNAAWIKGNLAATPVIANAIIAPNGLQNADKIVENSSSAAHFIYQNYTVISGTPYTFAIYAKAAERQFLTFNSSSGTFGDFVFATFNLTSGAVTEVGSSSTASISSVGDGWYRCSVRATPFAGGSAPIVWGMATTATPGRTPTYTGDGTSGIYLWGAQLSDSASLDTYVPNNFAAPTAAAYYGPRLDYDPSTLAAKGLLVEEQRSNVVLLNGMTSVTGSAGSQYPNATGWADEFNTGGTRTYVASNAVPGFNAIDISNVSNARNLISFSFSAASSTTYSVSFYIESFNGVTGAISYAVGALGTGGTSNIISSPTSTGRVSYTFTTGTGAGTVTIRLGIGVAQNQNGSIRISGLQVEAGSFSTSLIPTTSASVTRSADVAQVGTGAFPANEAEGTIIANFMLAGGLSTATNRMAVSLGAVASSSNVHNVIAMYASASRSRVLSYTATLQGDVYPANTLTANQASKVAFAYKTNDFAASLNAGTVATDTSGAVPTGFERMTLGAANSSSTPLNGWLRQITYIPRRLTNAELQSRTT